MDGIYQIFLENNTNLSTPQFLKKEKGKKKKEKKKKKKKKKKNNFLSCFELEDYFLISYLIFLTTKTE